MPCALPICILAGAALGSASAPTDSLVFRRTYAPGEKLTYTAQLQMSGTDMAIDSIVKLTVVKKTPEAKPQITVAADKYAAAGKDLKPSQRPRSLVVTLGANNLPEDLELKRGDSDIYTWLIIGAMTADKSVEVGAEFPISWSSKAGIAISIKGSGKLTALDPVAKTASVTWTFSVSTGAMDAGECVLKSVYDVANCSLKSCEGTLMNEFCTISIRRQ
jgi:hypothetical protein